MAKISLGLAFAIVVSMALYCSVMGQEDPWKSVIDQASKAGLSPDTLNEAGKAIGDGEYAAQDALGGGSLRDWVQQANDVTSGGGSPPAEAAADLPDDEDEVEESPAEAPQYSNKAKSPSAAYAPKRSRTAAPAFAPKNAPAEAPERTPTNAPSQTPSAAPQAQSPY